MENVERYKYVEVTYDPKSKEADTEYSWVEEKEDFYGGWLLNGDEAIALQNLALEA